MKLRSAFLALLALAACSPAATTTDTSATTTAAAAFNPGEGVTVNAPAANARVTSPLVATGVAPANWYFEAVFQAKLIGADGAVIAEGPAQSQEDWTNGNPSHPFRAELTFNVTQDTPATLVLREDMPDAERDLEPGQTPRPTREVLIPVVLTR